jgi:hypothetical protein
MFKIKKSQGVCGRGSAPSTGEILRETANDLGGH